eukprot:31510-Pelagococcus_subviridis.AAC.20
MISHDGGSSVVGTHSIGNEISCPAVVSTTRYVPARVSAYVASYVPFPMSTISPPCDVATCPSSTGNPSSSSDASRDASGAVAGAIAIAVAVGVASSRSGSKMANRTRAPPRSMRPPPGLALMSENFASAPATHSDAFVPAIVDNGKLTTPRALAIATSSPLLSSPRSTSATAGGSAATTRSARSASMSSNTLATNVMSIDPDAMIAANFSGASHPASVAASSSGSISIIAAPALNGSISEMMATSLSLSSVFARVCVFSSRTVSTTAANAEATSLGSIASHAADPAANSIRTIIIARLFVGIDARISPTTVASGILDAKIALSLGGKFPNTRAVSEYSIAARTTTAWSGHGQKYVHDGVRLDVGARLRRVRRPPGFVEFLRHRRAERAVVPGELHHGRERARASAGAEEAQDVPGELRGHLRQDRAGDTGGGGGDRTAAAAQRPDELRQPRPGAANLPAHELVHRRLRHRREVRRHLLEHRALGERHERERRALRSLWGEVLERPQERPARLLGVDDGEDALQKLRRHQQARARGGVGVHVRDRLDRGVRVGVPQIAQDQIVRLLRGHGRQQRPARVRRHVREDVEPRLFVHRAKRRRHLRRRHTTHRRRRRRGVHRGQRADALGHRHLVEDARRRGRAHVLHRLRDLRRVQTLEGLGRALRRRARRPQPSAAEFKRGVLLGVLGCDFRDLGDVELGALEEADAVGIFVVDHLRGLDDFRRIFLLEPPVGVSHAHEPRDVRKRHAVQRRADQVTPGLDPKRRGFEPSRLRVEPHAVVVRQTARRAHAHDDGFATGHDANGVRRLNHARRRVPQINDVLRASKRALARSQRAERRRQKVPRERRLVFASQAVDRDDEVVLREFLQDDLRAVRAVAGVVDGGFASPAFVRGRAEELDQVAAHRARVPVRVVRLKEQLDGHARGAVP